MTKIVKFEKLREEAIVPKKGTKSSNGFDLFSAESGNYGTVIIPAGERRLIRTGIRIALPEYSSESLFAFVTPRSGLALKDGITVLNSPGLVDSDFRGEIGVILYNTSKEEYRVRMGDKIAQLVILDQPRIELQEATEPLDKTQRGEGGFGSTGK